MEPTLLLIVGQTVTEASYDKRQLKPMVELIEQQSGQRPEAILADNGYCSEENMGFLASTGKPECAIEGFIATGKQKHGERRLPAKRGPLPKDATALDRMKRKRQTKVGKAIYGMNGQRWYYAAPSLGCDGRRQRRSAPLGGGGSHLPE